MNIAPFIYGRTKFEDHRFLAQPLDDFCTVHTFDWFKGFVRQVINTDHFGDIEIPRWSLAKKDGYLLWGCGVYLKMINNEYAFDVGGRPVRCFIGFLARENEQIENLPYGNDFLLSFFDTFIIPKWEETKNLPNKVREFVLRDFNGQNISKDLSFLELLNTNPRKLKFFPIDENDSINLFAAALSLNNISVVAGLNFKRHCQAAGFLNSTVFEVKEECIVDFADNSKLSDTRVSSRTKPTTRNENVDSESNNPNKKQPFLSNLKESGRSLFRSNRSSANDSTFDLKGQTASTNNPNYCEFQSSENEQPNLQVDVKSTIPFGFKFDTSINEEPVQEISNIDKLMETVNSKISIARSQANQQFEKEIISILEDIVKAIKQIPK